VTAFADALIDWQRRAGRHDLPWQRTRDPYRIWVSEVMLQQTQVATVLRYYPRFVERFPDPVALAEAMLSCLKRPDLLVAMGRASRVKAERRFDSGDINRATLDVLGLGSSFAVAA